MEAPLARVRHLVEAARRVAPDQTLSSALVESTGLSREGVALALTRSLETHPSERDLARLVGGAPAVPHVHVVLSANVFTAALRALAVAWASSSSVSVYPSRRDPVFAEALVRAVDHPSLTLARERLPASITAGEVHVYGRDATISTVRASVRPGVRVRGHGAGLGIAFVGPSADVTAAADAIAEDVILFDQRGCLSPRVVLVAGQEPRAFTLASALTRQLEARGAAVPRGALGPDERRDAARYVATMGFAGQVFTGASSVVGVGAELVLPPTGRHVHVVAVRDRVAAERAIAVVRPFVVAVGSDDLTRARELLGDAPRVRVSPLGEMQRPPLDGPVDLR